MGTEVDFELSAEDLRAVARFAATSAAGVLPVFEESRPGDDRPRVAVDAAWEFVHGAARTQRLRTAAFAAHRAAREAPTEVARLAARAAGDAAAAAYLHPLARAHQVGHVLRAAACAARVAELLAGGDPAAAARSLEEARGLATPTVVEVLRRYPPAPRGRTREAELMVELDRALRRTA